MLKGSEAIIKEEESGNQTSSVSSSEDDDEDAFHYNKDSLASLNYEIKRKAISLSIEQENHTAKRHYSVMNIMVTRGTIGSSGTN